MKKFVVFSIIGFGLFVGGNVFAVAENFTATFPVIELGNCGTKEACKAYCDAPEHMQACVAYAEKNRLMTKEEAQRAIQYADVIRGDGPGKCTDAGACKAYCEDVKHLDECSNFIEKHGLLGTEELKEIKQVAQALKAGESLPGGCTDKNSCKTYCADTSHLDECVSFAEKAGMMSKEEVEEVKKVLPFLKSGEMPGGCTDKNSCKTYCADTSHLDECVAFASKSGLMTQEEADIVKKTGGKGPGGCNSMAACESYCDESSHAEECFVFGKKYNLIPDEELKKMEEGMEKMKSLSSGLPEGARACIKEKLGNDVFGKIESGTFFPGKNTGEIIEGCIHKFSGEMAEKLKSAIQSGGEETKQCVRNIIGEEGMKAIDEGVLPEGMKSGDEIQKCFAKLQEDGLKKLREAIVDAPELVSCLESKIGKENVEKIKAGGNVELGSETGTMIQACATEMKNAIFSKIKEEIKSLPPSAQTCITEKFSKIQEGMDNGTIRSKADAMPYMEECTKLIEQQMQQGGGMPAGGPPSNVNMNEIPEQYRNMIPAGYGSMGPGEMGR